MLCSFAGVVFRESDKEVEMERSVSVRIDIDAERALAAWKALFAEQVSDHAQRLAERSGDARLVTLSHYRAAAKIALETVSSAISRDEKADGGREAA
jgi:hypothetical protein